jgi:hypothetical protein
MKKIILVGCMMLAVAIVNAQSFKITTSGGTDITNTTHIIKGAKELLKDTFIVENLTEVDKSTMLKRYETNVIPGTKNYFCWGDCFAPAEAGKHPLWYALEPINILAGKIESSCSLYHRPEGKSGKSTYLFVFYDENFPDDSAFVEVVFDVADYVGIQQLSAQQVSLKASPNPATDQFKVAYQLEGYKGSNARLVLVDLLGKKHAEYRLENTNGSVSIDASRLVPGIYFYSLQVDGTLIKTQKMIVR